MLLIGVDNHPSFQTIAFLVEETGEYDERRLNHSDGEAERFYRDLQQRGIRVRVGMGDTGYSRWFERLLAELGFEVWIDDPAVIKTKRVKRQKTDREDPPTAAEADAGKYLSSNLCTKPRQSGSATTAVAPASVGADAHANPESTAGAGDERGLSLEEKTIQRKGASAVREARLGSLGQSAPARVAGAVGPHESDH
ncbi:MAG: hypothetical protein WAK48_06275 [Candidatus Acidiferrum sp.]|jgi:hypothetical protein